MQAVGINTNTDNHLVEIHIGDKILEKLKSAIHYKDTDIIPRIEFETIGLPDAKVKDALLNLQFAPDAVEESKKILRDILLIDKELHETFLANIEDALKELQWESDSEDAAKAVADGNIGKE